MKMTFEIAVYNNDVRDALKRGENHFTLEDSWADTHLIEVRASTPEEAAHICRRKHPERKGFVHGDVTEAF